MNGSYANKSEQVLDFVPQKFHRCDFYDPSQIAESLVNKLDLAQALPTPKQPA